MTERLQRKKDVIFLPLSSNKNKLKRKKRKGEDKIKQKTMCGGEMKPSSTTIQPDT